MIKKAKPTTKIKLVKVTKEEIDKRRCHAYKYLLP